MQIFKNDWEEWGKYFVKWRKQIFKSIWNYNWNVKTYEESTTFKSIWSYTICIENYTQKAINIMCEYVIIWLLWSGVEVLTIDPSLSPKPHSQIAQEQLGFCDQYRRRWAMILPRAPFQQTPQFCPGIHRQNCRGNIQQKMKWLWVLDFLLCIVYSFDHGRCQGNLIHPRWKSRESSFEPFELN